MLDNSGHFSFDLGGRALHCERCCPSKRGAQGSRGLQGAAAYWLRVRAVSCGTRRCVGAAYCVHLVANGTPVGQRDSLPPPTAIFPGCWGDGRCSEGALRLQLPSLARH
eukprot:scaffold9128_cov126-Isochrysis_galbana.AAC.2